MPGAEVELRRLDLADLGSVREFCAVFPYDRLDLLVNNAGVMALPYGITVDGFETQFGVNHLGHFALTGLLLPALLGVPGARVVTVSSPLHAMSNIDIDDLNSERRYRRWTAYARSKTANLLFTHELARRLAGQGADVVAAAAHPGYADTNLQSAGPRMAGRRGASGSPASATASSPSPPRRAPCPPCTPPPPPTSAPTPSPARPSPAGAAHPPGPGGHRGPSTTGRANGFGRPRSG